MKSRKVAFLVTVFVVIQSLLLSASTAYSAKYEKLYEFLKDIKGWKAEEAQGMQMDMPEMKMIQATREYRKDESRVQVMVLSGSTSTMGVYTQQNAMKYEDEETKVTMKEIDGFRTHIIFDKEEKSGTITVILDSNKKKGTSVFVLSFENIDDGEALKIAKQFDWKGMKKRLAEL